MSISKETYVPSSFTLTFMDNFGARKVQYRSQKDNLTQYIRNEAKFVPKFISKSKVAFDKENLLEQVRQEKLKNRQMSTSNGFLRHQLSQSKGTTAVKSNHHLLLPQGGISSSLKREIELLVKAIEQQNLEMTKIKTSKKYNRFVQLQSAKDVYLQEIRSLENKISKDRYALGEQKRIIHEYRKRERDMIAMNKAIEIKILNENNLLIEEVEQLQAKIRENLQKELTQRRKKSRLVQEILGLQKLTGKLFIVPNQESPFDPSQRPGQERILERPPMLNEKEVILKDVSQKYEESYSEYEQEEEEEEDEEEEEEEEEEEQEKEEKEEEKKYEEKYTNKNTKNKFRSQSCPLLSYQKSYYKNNYRPYDSF